MLEHKAYRGEGGLRRSICRRESRGFPRERERESLRVLISDKIETGKQTRMTTMRGGGRGRKKN